MTHIIASATIVLGLATGAIAQTTAPSEGKLDFGAEGLTFPPTVIVNAHVPRTATLLGEAYRRHDPLEWKRAQYVSDLGQVALPAAAPFIVEAMTDPAPTVRAEAARAARAIAPPSETLLTAVEKLLADADPAVRREAVLSAATLAKALDKPTAAIERGLGDEQTSVIAAALEWAWTPQHAELVAKKLPTLRGTLGVEAARALARTKASAQAPTLLPLLTGDVPERAAATRALGELANAAQLDAVLRMLTDAHPTVRREAITAVVKLADAPTRLARAIAMLNDADPTVRQAAADVLNPAPSAAALAALAAQLPTDYQPLHEASREALVHPADAGVRDATVRLALDMLAHADPRRREDASYILGRLRSREGFDRHVQLLQWDPKAPEKTDWALVAQVAESMGRIGDSRAVDRLMQLAQLPTAQNLPPEGRIAIGQAQANALTAVGRLGHRPALEVAVAVLKADPLSGVPGVLRAAASFVVGAVGETGTVPAGVNFLAMYESPNETPQTKFEALKALGNLQYAPAAKGLKAISDTESGPATRWIAHWSYERAAHTSVPYAPPILRREPPVSISDLSR